MNQDIRNLQPALVWEIFDDITAVPRPSKSEEKICAWLIDFARQHSLDYRTDKAGNITIFAPATAGMEGRPTVVLQSHMDMVCEKNADTMHDFANDPIQILVKSMGYLGGIITLWQHMYYNQVGSIPIFF